MLLILIKSSFVGSCQVTDTICLPIEQAKKILTDAKKSDILQEKVLLLENDIALLSKRIVDKDEAIALYKALDNNNSVIILELEEQKKIMEEQRKVFEDQIKSYEKLLKRERRKRFWTAAGGVLSTGIVAYLYLTK